MDAKAWRVTHTDFPSMELIYAAVSRNQARYLCLKHADDAGYDLEYINAKATRAPEFDEEATEKQQGCLGWKEDGMRWGCLDIKETQ